MPRNPPPCVPRLVTLGQHAPPDCGRAITLNIGVSLSSDSDDDDEDTFGATMGMECASGGQSPRINSPRLSPRDSFPAIASTPAHLESGDRAGEDIRRQFERQLESAFLQEAEGEALLSSNDGTFLVH